MANPPKPTKEPKERGPRRPLSERAAEATAKAAILGLKAKFVDKPNEATILRAAEVLEKTRPTGRKDVDASVDSARAALRNAVSILSR